MIASSFLEPPEPRGLEMTESWRFADASQPHAPRVEEVRNLMLPGNAVHEKRHQAAWFQSQGTGPSGKLPKTLSEGCCRGPPRTAPRSEGVFPMLIRTGPTRKALVALTLVVSSAVAGGVAAVSISASAAEPTPSSSASARTSRNSEETALSG